MALSRLKQGSIPLGSASKLCFCTLHTNEILRTDPLVQVDYVCVVDLDIGANKSDICAIKGREFSAQSRLFHAKDFGGTGDAAEI